MKKNSAGHNVLFVIRSIINPGGGLHWISAWGYDEATDEFLYALTMRHSN